MSELGEQRKPEIGQICAETGITGDYINEFASVGWLKIGVGTYEEWIIDHQNRLALKYRERYPDDQFANVVTEQNRESILKLDEIVDKLNNMILHPDQGSKDKVIELVSQAKILIYGYDSWTEKEK